MVLTPQFSDGRLGVGAAGVSMNSKSSEDTDVVFDMLNRVALFGFCAR